MKKIALSVLVLTISFISFSQQRNIPPTYDNRINEPMENGFKKENLFLGGSLALGFGSYEFNIGATPEVGYSLNKSVDVGISLNLNYTSYRADPSYTYNNNTRSRIFNYGGGPFVRLYPLPFLFFQGQLEHNWLHYNQTDYSGAGNSGNFTVDANSCLLGIGYAQRVIGQSNFYFLIMMDVLNDTYSPYRDANNAALPVIRAGFNFYINSGRNRR